MKKFLFTLAALVAFGFAANAERLDQTCCTMSLSVDEISLHAGETQEIEIILNSLDVDWKGAQFEWQLVDPDGNLMTDGICLQFLQKYGSRQRYQYFGKTDYSASVTFSTSNGIASQQADILANPITGRYVWITSNAAEGVCYYQEYADEDLPVAIAKFTVEAKAGWNKPYATLKLVKSDVSAGDDNEYIALIQGLEIAEIKNLDYSETQEFQGTIEIGDNNERVVPITYMTNDPNAVAAVTVDGVAVNVAFNVEGPDADGIYTGTGSVTLGNEYKTYKVDVTLTPSADFEGEAETATREFTFTAPLPVPDISIQDMNGENGEYIIMIAPEEGAGELTVVAQPEAKRTETVNGITYLYYDKKAEAFDVDVLAETAANNAFQAGEAEKTITVPAMDKVKTPFVTYTYDNENGTITVIATCETEGAAVTFVGPDGNHAATYNSENDNYTYTFNYDIYEGYNENWYAYATAPYMTQSDNSATCNVVVAAAQKTTGIPTVVINDENDPTTITVTGEGTLTLYVGGEAVKTGESPLEYTIDWAPYGGQEQFLSVYAVAHIDGQIDGVSASQTAYVGVKGLGNLTGEIVFSEVNQNDGTYTVTYNGPEENVTVAIVSQNPKAGFTVATADGKLPEYGTYTVTATASKNGYNTISKTVDLTWNAPVLDPSTPATFGTPVIGETTVTVPVTGNVTGAVDQNGNPVAIENGAMVFERPAYPAESQTITVTVTTNDGEGYADATNSTDVFVPVMLPAPNIVIEEKDAYGWYDSGEVDADGQPIMVYGKVGKTYTLVDIETEVVGGTVWYTITKNGVQGEAKVWDGTELPLVGNGEWIIIAHVALGDVNSGYDTESLNLSDNFTGVNEIMNGKAVANVRYFNMAGQEMQEANGVTIVVTTYTDGTTSAVKVMK